MVALLDHPSILPVYEVGEHAGQPYFSMKWIDGGSLAEAVARSQESGINKEACRCAARIVATVARAVHHAHQRGVLHRDLKPSNILLDAEGRPYVTDFGLAKRVEVDSSLTESGILVGTPSYMAPEQAAGRQGTITTATDVYGLGAVLYALLAGRPPFRGETVLDTLTQVKEGDPRPPSACNPCVERELETICLKAMEKNPDDRYASALELAEDLEHFLENKPIRARPARLWERAWKWARRRRALAAVYGLLLLALALGGLGGGAIWLWQSAEAAHQEAVEARDQARIALGQEQQARAGEADARHHLAVVSYLHKVQLAHHAWMDNDLLRARLLLNACPEELRHWEWHHVHHLCHRELLSLQGHAGPVSYVVFSQDGQRLTSASEGETVRVWDLAAGRETRKFSAGDTGVAFSRDCKQAVSCTPLGDVQDGRSGESEIKVYDPATGQEGFKVKIPGSRIRRAVLSPDGKRLAATSNVTEAKTWRTLRGEIKVWDLTTRQETSTFMIEGACFGIAEFSPDGMLLAAGSTVRDVPNGRARPGEIQIWHLATGQRILALKNLLGTRFGFSPDGKQLACLAGDKLELWDIVAGKQVRTLKSTPASFAGAAFSPNGKRLASWGSPDKAIRVWDLTTGRGIVALKGHTHGITCVAFSPDGRAMSRSESSASPSAPTAAAWLPPVPKRS
jgi:WD40 repeat protein